MRYRGEIDGLRAIAVLAVVFFHLGIKTFRGGFVGVDVFFVISGYLITSIILKQIHQQKFSLTQFYVRRMRRLLPALFFVMSIAWIVAYAEMLPGELLDFGKSYMAISVFSSNIFFYQMTGYFGRASELHPFLHTWSLAIEEQFYLLFPLLLLFAYRFRKKWWILSVVLITVLSFGALFIGGKDLAEAKFYLLPFRAWELLLGALVGIYLFYNKAPKSRPILAGLGLALIGYGIFFFSKKTTYPSELTLFPTVGTALIILFAGSHQFVGKWLNNRILVLVGLCSYSIYLWHQPVLAFIRLRTPKGYTPIENSLIIFVVLILGYLTWKFVEQPFRHSHKISNKFIVSLSLAMSIVFMGCGYWTSKKGGLHQRFASEARSLIRTTKRSPMGWRCGSGVENKKEPKSTCILAGYSNSWAVVGDSHARELSFALAKELLPYEKGVHQFSLSGGGPCFNLSSKYPECAKWTDNVVQYITNNKEIEHVVIAYRMRAHLMLTWKRKMSEKHFEARDLRWEAYKNLITHFEKQGKNVVVLIQAPELKHHVNYMIKDQIRNEKYGEVFLGSLSNWKRSMEYVYSRLGEISKTAKIVDASDSLCNETKCLALKGGESYYYDNNHLSIPGARLVAKDIVSAVYPQPSSLLARLID